MEQAHGRLYCPGLLLGGTGTRCTLCVHALNLAQSGLRSRLPRSSQAVDVVHLAARRIGVSEGTVRTHLQNIYERLQVSSRTAAVTSAFPDLVAP
jgi:hypothetical protein